jgi:two-component system, NarL family, nitrate/nitrite response regulator NarL
MRLVISDCNRILGEALGAVLQDSEHEVVAVVTSADDCVSAVTAGKPDICLLEIRIPRLEDGVRAVREIRSQCPGTAVVVLSDLSDRRTWSQASELEIAALVSKDRSVTQIVAALDAVMDGGVVFDQGPWRKPLSTTSAIELTPREAEVLHRMIAGQDTRRMAAEMNVTVSTLRTYVKNLLAKLGAHSRLEAVALASRANLPHAAFPAQRPPPPGEAAAPPFDVAVPRQAGIPR